MTVKKSRKTPSLTRVSARLQADLATLKEAFQFAETATGEFLAERTSNKVTHQVTTSYAAWVHFTYGSDLDKYTELLEQVLKARTNGGTSLFGWDEPQLSNPNPDADRLLDRIDLGLHFVQRRLKIKLPRELKGGDTGTSIRSGGDKTSAMLARVGAFVDASHDLFA
jgi:hypothetical protein